MAIKINPKYAVAYYIRGTDKAGLKDKKGAIKDLNKAGELGDGNAYEAIKEIKGK